MSTESRGISRCAAALCRNTSRNSHYSFFRFPKDPDKIKDWAIRSGREDLLKKKNLYNLSYKLCGLHFENIMFLNNLQNRLHKHAVPTVFPALKGTSSSTEQDPLQDETKVKIEVKTEDETEYPSFQAVYVQDEEKIKTEDETEYPVHPGGTQIKVEVKTEPPEDMDPYEYVDTLYINVEDIENNMF